MKNCTPWLNLMTLFQLFRLTGLNRMKSRRTEPSKFHMNCLTLPPRNYALVVVLCCALASSALRLVAADSLISSVQPFLQKHCVECHDGETKEGRLDLTALSSGLTYTST